MMLTMTERASRTEKKAPTLGMDPAQVKITQKDLFGPAVIEVNGVDVAGQVQHVQINMGVHTRTEVVLHVGAGVVLDGPGIVYAVRDAEPLGPAQQAAAVEAFIGSLNWDQVLTAALHGGSMNASPGEATRAGVLAELHRQTSQP